MNSYVGANPIHLTVQFQDASGNAGDPNLVVLKIRAPDGTITTYTYGVDASLFRDSVGLYHFDLLPSALPGVWTYRFDGTGGLFAANEAEIFIQPSDFGVSL